MPTIAHPFAGKNHADDVEQRRVESKPAPPKSLRYRIRIHLVFGVIGILALLSEGLIIHTLLTTQFNDTIDTLDTDQQEILLFGAHKTLLDKVNSWLKVSETIGAKFQRRLNNDPTMLLAHIWNETFIENNSTLIDADACALVNAVQNEVTAISIDRDGSNYKGDPSKPVDYNASDSTVFANYKFLDPCPMIMTPGKETDVRFHRYCFNYETSKVEGFFGYSQPFYDDDGLDRRFVVERDNEEIWDALIAADGKFTFSWQLLPLSPTYTVLIFVSGMIYRLDDGKNLTAMIGQTAEDLAEGLASEMCSFKWKKGEFCESFLIEHTSFRILAWASNGASGGYVGDIQSLNSTSIQTVHADLASKVHDTYFFEDQHLGVRTGRWLYSAERVLGDSETTFGDGGSLWIALVHDRDELQEEGDEMAQQAVVTLVVTMVVAATIYVVMLWYYASRIKNLRMTLRTIQNASPHESTNLVDHFVDNSRIHEVHQIADEFGSVIHSLADANAEKRIVQEEQLAERTFLAYMSHHIRTPLHGVLGTCEIVLDRTKEPETKEYLDAVMQCGNSLLVLLNDSIDLSRMQANKMEIEVGPVDVAKVMKVVKVTFEAQLQRGGRDLRTANPSGQDLYCIADSARLVQVTTNLVSNAIKYSKSRKQITSDARNPVFICSHLWDSSSDAPVMTKLLGDAMSSIPGAEIAFDAPDVLTKQVGKPPVGGEEYVVISVTDFGRGIPENKLVKLFSPFAQMRTEDSECGAGLGLNMCFHVAILLGGFTGVVTREGQGSIFYIAVPATIARKLKEEEKTNEEAVHESDTIVVDKDNDIVLVVDDTKVNRLILSRHLESLGLRSIQACDGQEAVNMVAQHRGRFRCVLTDLDMPVMDGLTAASLIKRDYPDLPIMCVSANSTPKDVQLAKEAGCVGLLGKPFTKPMLKKAVAMMA